jgi:putative RNA 2'-phosphotransferase
MLKECASHGYFRSELCPVCGSQARFLLNDQEVEMIGRTMAGVLRHFPQTYGLTMDANGWVDLRDFITALGVKNRRLRFVRPHHILGLIDTDAKGRYQHRDGRIRATYGHSLDVDLDLPTEDVPETLFYPASEEESRMFLQLGLKPADRKMVHLSGTWHAAHEAGSVRTQSPVILEVDARAARQTGLKIMKAGKTVFLAREVPPEFLKRSDRVAEELTPEG